MQNAEAEIGIIGAILIDNRALAVAREAVAAEDFYSETNRLIYRAMIALDDARMPINAATVFARIGDNPVFNEAGGIGYIQSCSQRIPSASIVPTYAEIVRTESTKRKMCAFGRRLEEMAGQPLDNVNETIAAMSAEMLTIADNRLASKWTSFADSVTDACGRLSEPMPDCIGTGFDDLDRMITGFYPGTLTIVAARPAMGKTAFGLCIASHTAIVKRIPVGFFTCEMTSGELTNRILSARACVDGNAIKRHQCTVAEMERILDVASKIGSAPLHIDETSAIDIDVLQARARDAKRMFNIGMIIVDYLQLMTASSRKVQSREQEVACISRGLKEIAKELSIPVIALSQLNRALESRAEKRPMLADLRESGSIEQDADNVMFLHREDYYTKGNTGKAEVIIAKQRSGPTGVVELHWDGRFTKFSNLDRGYNGETF
jgi:replicative DNA helicase